MHQMLLETFYKRLTEEKGYFINGVSRQVCPGRAGGGNQKNIYIYIYICTQDEKRILQALQVSKKIRPFQLIYPPPKKTIKTYNMLHMAQKFELHQKINDICPLVQS